MLKAPGLLLSGGVSPLCLDRKPHKQTKPLALCRLEGRPPRLDLELYPYLPRVRVNTTSARDYLALLSGRVA